MSQTFEYGKLARTVKTCYQIDVAIGFNSLIFYLKKLPFLGKYIPETLYKSAGAKSIISTTKLIFKILAIFFRKAIYLFVMVCLPVALITNDATIEEIYQLSMNSLVLLSFFIGSLFKNVLLTNSMNKYICIRLMRIHSRYYLLGDFIFAAGKDLAGFIVVLPVLTLIFRHGIMEGLICAWMLIACHIAGEALSLFVFDKTKIVLQKKLLWVSCVMVLSLGLLTLQFMFDFPLNAWSVLYQWPAIILVLMMGAGSFYYIARYPYYPMVASETVSIKDIIALNKTMSETRKADVKLKDKDLTQSDDQRFSHLSAYHFLNAIFFRRHRRMLYIPVIRRVAIIGGFFLIAVITFYFEPSFVRGLAQKLPNTLPFCVFIMYQLTSNSQKVCKAMYANCDASLLHYGFYRKPEVILLNFRIRLKALLKSNLLIGSTLALCAVGIAIITGTAWKVPQMLLYMITIISMGVFFSVHYLFLYYFFQPYTADMTVKSPIFSIINGVIYILCLASFQLGTAPSFFSLIVLVSTIAYILLALLLVFKYSPVRFRNR